MTNLNNYPVKYAVLELKKVGGYAVGYDNITRGIIASKCYLLESTSKYLDNGEVKNNNKVFFPYTDIATYRDTKRIIEEKITKNCLGDAEANRTVEYLFDTYEDAKAAAIIMREKYRESIRRRIGYTCSESYISFLKDVISVFDSYTNICDSFEADVEIINQDLEVTKNLNKTLNNRKSK